MTGRLITAALIALAVNMTCFAQPTCPLPDGKTRWVEKARWSMQAMPGQSSRRSDNFISTVFANEAHLAFTADGIGDVEQNTLLFTIMEDKPGRPDKARSQPVRLNQMVKITGFYHKETPRAYIGRVSGVNLDHGKIVTVIAWAAE